MKIELVSEKGLVREFKGIIPSADIQKQKMDYIKSRANKVRIDGFRPGKVPQEILEQRLGDEALHHVLRKSVDSCVTKTIKDHEIRQAGEPQIDFDPFEEGKDFGIKMVFETLPEIKLKDFGSIELEKLSVDVPDAEVEKALQNLNESHKAFTPVQKERAVKDGDRVSCEISLSFNGKKLPQYQKATVTVDVGSKTFMIDGIDAQLKKMKEGETATFKGSVAKNFGDNHIAGQEVDVTLSYKKHLEAKSFKIDDEFAKEFGKDTLADLKAQVRENLEESFQSIARLYMKRHMLDALEKEYKFDLPETMVKVEFESIWQQLQAEIQQSKESGEYDEKEAKPEDELRKEYRGIAERRVRLGLVISEVARSEKIQLSQEELRNALFREALRYPGQEKQVMEYFRSHPQFIDRVAAPMLEDKVVDHIATKIKTKDVKVDVNGLKKKVKGVVPTLFDDEENNKAA